MTQRIAPNNQLPATHFIEVFVSGKPLDWYNVRYIEVLDDDLSVTEHTSCPLHTIAIFRIRENKLPTKHKF